MSRTLQALAADGLVTIQRSAGDGRVRTARLTRSGAAERQTLDRLADQAAGSVLAPLTGPQRARMVAAMTEVERLMRASMVTIAPGDPRLAAAGYCIQGYFDELAERFDDGFDPAVTISATADELTPPAGLLLLATLHDEPVGCGALKFHAETPAEIKRMWVAPAARGLGLGRRLLDRTRSPRTRGGRDRCPAGDKWHADRGDRDVPERRLPRGARVQRRAVRASLVREGSDRGLAARSCHRPPRAVPSRAASAARARSPAPRPPRPSPCPRHSAPLRCGRWPAPACRR